MGGINIIYAFIKRYYQRTFLYFIMLNNPLNRLAMFTVRFIFRTFNINQSLLTLFSSLFSLSSILINTIGFRETLRIFWRLRDLTFRNTNLTVFLQRLNLQPFIISLIQPILEPYFKDILNNIQSYKKIIYFISFYSGLRLFKPAIFYLSRFTIGTIFSTIGILWNETLQSYELLKDFAYLMKGILDQYLDLQIPVPIINENDNESIIDIDYENSGKWFSILGGILIGISGSIIILITLDCYSPTCHEIISDIPYINYILDPIYNIYNWFYPSSSPSDNNNNNNNFIPDVITRNNSNGTVGSITPRANPVILPTPPFSRNDTPLPLTDDSFNNYPARRLLATRRDGSKRKGGGVYI